MTEHTFVLPDGRRLGYARYGADSGWPVLYFHGSPSSRLELQLLAVYGINIEKDLLEAGLMLFAIDRPGIGLSDFHSGRSLLSFAGDVHTFLNALAISRCSVLCWSGGGPYALAMAEHYSSQVKDVFILCGFSRRLTGKVLHKMSRNKWYFRAAKYAPWLLKLGMNRIRNRNAVHTPPQWLAGLPDADYQLIRDPGRFNILMELTLKEACRKGAGGAVQEARLYFRDFGFDLSDIWQPVHFWWGTEDKNVIHLHAEAVEKQMKNSIIHYKKKEGHLSLYIHCFKEVLLAISLASRT